MRSNFFEQENLSVGDVHLKLKEPNQEIELLSCFVTTEGIILMLELNLSTTIFN